MTGLVQGLAMGLVAVVAAVVVRTRDPARQVVAVGLYGTALALLFLALQAPDVALSQIGVGVAYPVMILLALAKSRERSR